MKTYIGIDNGISGSIGIVNNTGSKFFLPPTTSAQDYVKKKRNKTRINAPILAKLLRKGLTDLGGLGNCLALIERPMVNPTRFQSSTSALRALEATLIVLESLTIPYQFIDSKEWQKVMLPKGIKGAPFLKKASQDIGTRLFPQFKFKNDADGILIAEWAKRINL